MALIIFFLFVDIYLLIFKRSPRWILLLFINMLLTDVYHFLSGILRYKIDLESIQMMMDEDYCYDKEDYDLEEY